MLRWSARIPRNSRESSSIRSRFAPLFSSFWFEECLGAIDTSRFKFSNSSTIVWIISNSFAEAGREITGPFQYVYLNDTLNIASLYSCSSVKLSTYPSSILSLSTQYEISSFSSLLILVMTRIRRDWPDKCLIDSKLGFACLNLRVQVSL